MLIGAGAAFAAGAVVLATLPLGVVRAARTTWRADAREGWAAVAVADRAGPAPVLWGCVAGLAGCTAALFAVRDIRTLTWRSEPEAHKVER